MRLVQEVSDDEILREVEALTGAGRRAMLVVGGAETVVAVSCIPAADVGTVEVTNRQGLRISRSI